MRQRIEEALLILVILVAFVAVAIIVANREDEKCLNGLKKP
jgi:hypothetical protein